MPASNYPPECEPPSIGPAQMPRERCGTGRFEKALRIPFGPPWTLTLQRPSVPAGGFPMSQFKLNRDLNEDGSHDYK